MMPTSNLSPPQQLDAAHHIHPFSDTAEIAQTGPRVLTRGEGVYVWDAQGNKLLDAFAGLWCVTLGYGRSELVRAAAEQMQQLPYYNSFSQCTTEPTIRLAAKLAELAPGDLNHTLFTNSGSEAADTIVRMVRHFWAVQGQPQRNVIIGRHNGYHGSTIGAASLGGMKGMYAQGGLPIPNITHIAQPYWFGEGGKKTPEEFGRQRAALLEKKILKLGPERVAAFVAEPIQGAAGVFIPPDSYWPDVQQICRLYDVLLVVDEVVCGFGRTGHWFGSQHFGVQPDIISIATGLTSGYIPMGGVMFNERIASVLKHQGGELAQGYSYSGHPVCAAVALENLRILHDENIVDAVANDTGPYLAEGWMALADHPLVGEARIVGMLGALELVPNKPKRTFFDDHGRVGELCRSIALRNGLILRSTADAMLLSPPLTISRSEIDELLEKTRRSLDETAVELGILRRG